MLLNKFPSYDPEHLKRHFRITSLLRLSKMMFFVTWSEEFIKQSLRTIKLQQLLLLHFETTKFCLIALKWLFGIDLHPKPSISKRKWLRNWCLFLYHFDSMQKERLRFSLSRGHWGFLPLLYTYKRHKYFDILKTKIMKSQG